MEYHIENERLRLVVSRLGAEMHSLRDKRTETEFLWQGDETYWGRRAPILFPIIGRVRNGIYSFLGKTYSIDIPHGFAKTSRFRVEYQEKKRVGLSLESTPETLAQYPFPFCLDVEYLLDGMELIFRFRVTNTGEQRMPFSSGTHPGFRVPLEKNERFEDYRLRFASDEHLRRILLDGMFLSGEQMPFPLQGGVLPLTRRLFDEEAIILGGFREKAVSLWGPNARRRFTIHFEDFRYLAIWRPAHSDAPFVCLETWNGLPDPVTAETNALDRKPGIDFLEPGQSSQTTLRLEIDP